MIEIDLISPEYPGFSVNISGTFIQQACSYKIIFQDTSTVNNPLFDRGELTYHQVLIDGSERLLGQSVKGSTGVFDFCLAGSHTVRKRFIIREATVNGCPGQIIYQEYTDFEVNTFEWQPLLELEQTNCCYLQDVETTFLPSAIALNNNVCQNTPILNAGYFVENPLSGLTFNIESIIDNFGTVIITSTGHNLVNNSTITISNTTSYNGQYVISNVGVDTFEITSLFFGNQTGQFSAIPPGIYSPIYHAAWNGDEQILEYKVFYYDLNLNTWVQEASNGVIYGVPTSDINDYPLTFTPNKLTKYKIQASLTNCCMTVEKEFEFSVCDSITITPACLGKIECNECTDYHLDNYLDTPAEVKVYDLVLNKQIHTFTIEPLSRYIYSFTEDGVYGFELPISEEKIIVVSLCNIDKCYTNLLKMQLCRTKNSSACCDDRFLESRLLNVQAFYQTYLHMIDPYTDLNLRFAKSDITKLLSDFQEIGRLKNIILEFCDVCKRFCNGCFNWEKGNCL